MPEPQKLGRVLVTGGAGFIGGHLVRALVEQGCRPTLLARGRGLDAELGGRVDWLHCDLTASEGLERLLEECAPDTIFHLAGVRGNGGAASASLTCAQVNVTATVQLLDAAKRTGVRRVILTGSADEYGGQPGPLHEALPLLPETPYGITKAAATRLAQTMAHSEGCRATVLRPFSVYGPGQPDAMFVAQAVRCAVHGETFRMTHGRQRRDLVFVSDVVQALLAAATTDDLAGEVVNVGSGQPWALCDVARLIWRLTGSEAPLEIGGRPAPAAELHDTWADITKAKERLGWEPRVDLASGLRATIEWARRESREREQACPVG